MASPFLAPPQKLRGGAPTKRQVVGRVASPHLEGGQVAVLCLHASSAGHVTKAAYTCVRQGYVRYGTKVRLITKEAPNFVELRKGEVRSIHLPRTRVDRASVGEVRLVASYAGREGPKQGSGYFVFDAHPVGWTGSCGGRRPLLLRINTVPPYQVPDRFARYS